MKGFRKRCGVILFILKIILILSVNTCPDSQWGFSIEKD
jgi:hypothetical protein